MQETLAQVIFYKTKTLIKERIFYKLKSFRAAMYFLIMK